MTPLNISCRELWLWDPTLSMRLFLKGHILSGKGFVQWINGMWVMRGRTWIDSCDNALLLAQAVGMLITKTHAVMSRHRKTARPMQSKKRPVKGRVAWKAYRLYEWRFKCFKCSRFIFALGHSFEEEKNVIYKCKIRVAITKTIERRKHCRIQWSQDKNWKIILNLQAVKENTHPIKK